jgi:hypothetical protein
VSARDDLDPGEQWRLLYLDALTKHVELFHAMLNDKVAELAELRQERDAWRTRVEIAEAALAAEKQRNDARRTMEPKS